MKIILLLRSRQHLHEAQRRSILLNSWFYDAPLCSTEVSLSRHTQAQPTAFLVRSLLEIVRRQRTVAHTKFTRITPLITAFSVLLILLPRKLYICIPLQDPVRLSLTRE